MNIRQFGKDPMQEPLAVLPLIFGGLLSGMLLFGVVAILVAGQDAIFSLESRDPFTIAVAAFFVSVLPGSFVLPWIFKGKTTQITEPRDKERLYLVSCLARWALLEGLAIICGVAVLVSRNLIYLMPLALSLLFFLAAYPSRARFEAFAGQGCGARVL